VAHVLVVTLGKGGVGKNTSTAALGAALAHLGDKVVVVDFDVGLRNLDLVPNVGYIAFAAAVGDAPTGPMQFAIGFATTTPCYVPSICLNCTVLTSAASRSSSARRRSPSSSAMYTPAHSAVRALLVDDRAVAGESAY
jgi:hypothetical protein